MFGVGEAEVVHTLEHDPVTAGQRPAVLEVRRAAVPYGLYRVHGYI